MRKLKKTLRILALIIIAVLLWIMIDMFRVRVYSKKYFESESDIAIVLGAGTSNGKLSPVFRERVNHAVNLLNNGKVKYIIFTGGYGAGQNISDSEAAMKYAIEKGADSTKILLEKESTITFYNLLNAKKIMDSHKLKSALIVSDPYHMLRAHKMCNKFGIQNLPSPTPTTMYKTRKSKTSFLISEAFNFWLFEIFERFRRNS